MLSLIHNIRIDREKKSNSHSFNKSLNNYNTSDLELSNGLGDQILSANWLDIYRRQ